VSGAFGGKKLGTEEVGDDHVYRDVSAAWKEEGYRIYCLPSPPIYLYCNLFFDNLQQQEKRHASSKEQRKDVQAYPMGNNIRNDDRRQDVQAT